MTWKFVDHLGNVVIDMPNIQDRATLDFTWEGIRKGGKRWYVPLQQDAVTIEAQNPLQTGPDYATPFQHDPTKTQPIIQGITNTKKCWALSMKSNNGTNADWLQYNAYDGTFIRSVTWSNGFTNRLKQLVFLEKQFAVIDVGTGPESVKFYDENAVFIKSLPLPFFVGFPFPTHHGITWDGKQFYMIWRITILPTIISAIEVLTADMNTLEFINAPANMLYASGITFNGRYLIVNIRPASE